MRPLVQITGDAGFNEVFIEEARVPADNVVGAVDNGWRVAITTLTHERGRARPSAVQVGATDRWGGCRRASGKSEDPLVPPPFGARRSSNEVLRLLTTAR